ncbi:MAG: hypothetical protein WD267_12160 [Balneolales bacterium]
MKKIYYLWYLAWLLPLFLTALGIQQVIVYQGIQDTMSNGKEYQAEVLDFQMKHMAAQSNGIIVLKFTPKGSEPLVKKLSLPIQNAGLLMQMDTLPIRYHPESTQSVVILPTLWFQEKMVLANIGVILLSVITTLFAGYLAHRYANRLRKNMIKVQPTFETIPS